jgi:hypothetical protein
MENYMSRGDADHPSGRCPTGEIEAFMRPGLDRMNAIIANVPGGMD